MYRDNNFNISSLLRKKSTVLELKDTSVTEGVTIKAAYEKTVKELEDEIFYV